MASTGVRSSDAAGRARRWGWAAAAQPQPPPPSRHAPPHLGPATSGDSQAPTPERLREKKRLRKKKKKRRRGPSRAWVAASSAGGGTAFAMGEGTAIPPENEGNVSV